jgi:acetylornithine deacetylase/succinyl-diaminopimelate desuccinylase-like protein
MEMVRPPSVKETQALQALPWDAAAFARDAGMVPGSRFAGAPTASVYERMWYRPSLTINGLLSVDPKTAPNQLTDRAEARVTLRTVPDIEPTRAAAMLREAILRDPPFGVRVEVRDESPGWWWSTDPVGPAFDAAARAMEVGYGRPCTFIGCGGSIPFVNPFARVLGGVPALLLGLEDPTCNAHGENESLHLGDWKKGMRAAAVLYGELAQALPR